MNEIIIERVTALAKARAESPTASMTASGVSKDFFCNLRKNTRPSVEKIAKLATYFNVTTDYLLGRTNNPAPPTGNDPPTAPEGELGREVVARAMTEIEGLSDDQVREVIRYAAYIKTRQNE
ncbi:MAG: hypothetical protein FWH04_01245 [Oscillospiraceae bacterium]|nr:hypothetical protein [Oscillospiraceae bacterium]